MVLPVIGPLAARFPAEAVWLFPLCAAVNVAGAGVFVTERPRLMAAGLLLSRALPRLGGDRHRRALRAGLQYLAF